MSTRCVWVFEDQCPAFPHWKALIYTATRTSVLEAFGVNSMRDLKLKHQAIGIPTQGRPHAEPLSSSTNPSAFSDVRRYVLGANIIEHVTNSNTVIPDEQHLMYGRRSFRDSPSTVKALKVI